MNKAKQTSIIFTFWGLEIDPNDINDTEKRIELIGDLIKSSSTVQQGVSFLKLLFDWTEKAQEQEQHFWKSSWNNCLNWTLENDFMVIFWSTFLLMKNLNIIDEAV